MTNEERVECDCEELLAAYFFVKQIHGAQSDCSPSSVALHC